MAKKPRFEVHFTPRGHYQWYLKYRNQVTLAQGQAQGFKSLKSCVNALEHVRRLLNEANIRGHFTRPGKPIFYVNCTDPREIKR